MSKRHEPAGRPPQRRPPHTRPRPAPLDALVTNLYGAISELDAAAASISKYAADPESLFDLGELADHATRSVAFLRDYIDDLAEAQHIVGSDVSLATTYGTGSIWAGRQRPRYVVRL